VRVWMPTQRYNGRYLGTGNGGYAGGFFFSELADGINRGFATANTDMGAVLAAGVNADAMVGHPERWKDFGWRATHLMTTFSRALIASFYGDGAKRNYFSGCSTGGEQALMETQRFPDDYDGVLAGAPAFNRTHLHTVLISQYRATHLTAESYIPPTKLDLVNQSVLAQCRAKDGGAPTDPFLTDPRDCKVDLSKVACPIGDGLTCLNADQVRAMEVYYKGSVNLASGAIINPISVAPCGSVRSVARLMPARWQAGSTAPTSTNGIVTATRSTTSTCRSSRKMACGSPHVHRTKNCRRSWSCPPTRFSSACSSTRSSRRRRAAAIRFSRRLSKQPSRIARRGPTRCCRRWRLDDASTRFPPPRAGEG